MAAPFVRLVCLAALVGCYQPAPAEGAPCATSAECPTPLACFSGHCRAEAPPIDAPPVSEDDAPIGIDAPAATGCPTSATLCDGFENGLSAWTVSISSAGGTVVTSSQTVHSGTLALDATVPVATDNGHSAFAARRFTVQSTGMLAAREFVFSPDSINAFRSMMIFQQGSDQQYASVAGDTAGKWAVTEQSTAGLVDHHSTLATVAQQWLCVELDYTFSPTPHVQLYIDDVLALDVDTADPAPAFTEVGLGVTRATATGYRLFVDDAVIATTHIGCN